LAQIKRSPAKTKSPKKSIQKSIAKSPKKSIAKSDLRIQRNKLVEESKMNPEKLNELKKFIGLHPELKTKAIEKVIQKKTCPTGKVLSPTKRCVKEDGLVAKKYGLQPTSSLFDNILGWF
jgi:hypothetical protein